MNRNTWLLATSGIALAVLAACAASPSVVPFAPAPAVTPEPAPSSSPAEQRGTSARPTPSPASSRAPEQSCAPLQLPLPDVPMGEHDVAVPAIVDGQRLAPFYARLAALARGRSARPVRIAVYGDSNLTMDFITGQMRRVLQRRYGDAGHGFVALARPWSHYQHMDVEHDVRRGFEAYVPSTNPSGDGAYGISGIAAESLWRRAETWVATAGPDAPVGHKASRFEVFYWQKPKRGSFEIRVDGERRAVVDTAAEEPVLGHHRLELADEAHRIEIEVVSRRGRVRLFGAVLERDVPGVVVDSFGVGSLNTRAQAREDPKINHAMLQHRGYDLVIFTTGANDLFTMDVAPRYMAEIIELHRQALPGLPVLFVSPADRGKKGTNSRILPVVEQRKQMAKDHAAAFWNLWEAMGGVSSMARFQARGMAMDDCVHFNQAGGAYVADRLLYALLRDLNAYARAHPELGCTAASPRSAL